MLTWLAHGWAGIYNQAGGNVEAVLVTEIYLDESLEGYNDGVLLSVVLGHLITTNSASDWVLGL